MKKVLCLGLAFLCLLSLVSCGNRSLSKGTNLLSYDPVDHSGESTYCGDETFVKAATDFCFEFLGRSISEDENALVSPMSAMYCLGMITSGADGQTKAQLEEVLGMDGQTLDKFLCAYKSALGNDVSLADSIWFRDVDSLRVRDAFLQNCARWYGAEIYAAPFDETTRRDINTWVDDKTEGMIDKILEDPIPAESMMYLINAIAFDAKWDDPFEREQDGKFAGVNDHTSRVKMLCSMENSYLEASGFYGVAKYYEGGQYCFVGLLPTDPSVSAAEAAASLTGEDFREIWNSKRHTRVTTQIPEFSYDCEMSLREMLCDMGADDMFSAANADFSLMAEYEGGNLCCSDVKQKTFIELDKEGTRAAAVTWGEMKASSVGPVEEPKTVILDHPFLYAIVDSITGLPLFLGVVNAL